MDENTFKLLAQQLRKPEGEMGRQTGERMNVGNRFMNEATIEALQLRPNDSILEIGMGNGFFVKDILQVDSSIKYTGCDFSELMVEEAIQRNKEFVEEGRATFLVANADNLPFQPAVFNKVFTVNTIYFWEDVPKTFEEIKRVLRTNGILIITIRPKESMQHIPVVKYGFNLFSEEDITELLFENGFTPIHAREIQEPDQEIAGVKLKMESMIIVAEKNG